MLSTFPTVMPYESLLGNPFPASDGASTPWECPDIFPAFQTPEPAVSDTGLDVFQYPKPVISNSSSDNHDENPDQTDGPDKPSRKLGVVDERKRRRMESNRESAKRSRMRKQRHLENLRNSVNRLRVENRELSNRLGFSLYHVHRVRTENVVLESELTILQRKLICARQALILRQLQEFSCACPVEQNQPTISQYNYNNNLINC